MPQQYMSFAPVRSVWNPPSEIILPYYFCEDVSYRPIPELVMREEGVDELRSKVRQEITEGATHCVAIEYEADSFGAPDNNWTGPGRRSIQRAATELMKIR